MIRRGVPCPVVMKAEQREEDAISSTSKTVGPKARATLKLPKLQGCTVSVTASFEGGGQVDVGEFDICKDKTIRFTD